ncbi:hypothetical protein AB0M80_42395 [Amycolatopsis sp. NPDC051045]|uniref:TRAFAC clade GTPase domain-containing protein n=1 Tax=Amycolatopsis sp. NPDC051045 TaxID=3156922 RepID=UPI003418126E
MLITAVTVVICLLLALPAIHGVRYATVILGASGRAFARAMGLGKEPHTAEIPKPSKGVANREYAHERYLRRQSWRDFRHANVRVWSEVGKTVKSCWEKLRVLHPAQVNPPRPEYTTFRRTAGAGVLIGTAVAAVVIAGLALAEAVALGVLFVAEYGFLWVLAGVDALVLRVRGVTMTCRNCGHRLTRAEYTCPGCKVRHHNLRPGRYGLLHRTCGCGYRLASTALSKNYRLESWCPHCDKPLAKETGLAGEIVIPLFGAPGAGKSQLITVLTVAIETLADRTGGTFAFADDQTRGNATKAWRGLVTTKRSEKTTLVSGATTVPAYSMYVKPRRGQMKLLHVFDAQGEVFYRSDKIQQLEYLRVAKTFVFVVDPLSIDRLWTSIAESHRPAMEKIRAQQEPSKTFHETVMTVIAMGIDLRKVHLVVALSKADLIEDSLRTVDRTDDGSIRAWLVDKLAQGNLVRAMDNNFKSVSFFLTSALATGHDTADSSVESFAERTLATQGFKL